MTEKIGHHAEEMHRASHQRGHCDAREPLWGQLLCGAVLSLVVIGLITGGPRLYTLYEAIERAAAEAKEAAERAYYPKRPEDRVPQYSLEEVTEFATAFLRKMGYTLHGELEYTHWTTTDAWGVAYKQYHFYAVIDPAWPPLALRCGPWRYYERRGLTCMVTK